RENPSDGGSVTPMRAPYVRVRNSVASSAKRSPGPLTSKPSSTSRVRSGPNVESPTCATVTPGLPSSPATGSQVRTASNAPGALPDSPSAARSLSVGILRVGQKLSSDSTYEALTFGYDCRPKLLPN